MNKFIASIFSVLFAILSIIVIIFLIYSSSRTSGYIFFGGLLLFVIFFGFLAVLLDIRDEIIRIREKIVGDSGPNSPNGHKKESLLDYLFSSLGIDSNLSSKDDKSEKNNWQK